METQHVKENIPLADWQNAYDHKSNYGMFGYKGLAIDQAVAKDDAEAILEAHRREWIDKDTRTFMNTPLRRLAANKGSVNVEAALAELGYPD
jgi:hypothetical protein